MVSLGSVLSGLVLIFPSSSNLFPLSPLPSYDTLVLSKTAVYIGDFTYLIWVSARSCPARRMGLMVSVWVWRRGGRWRSEVREG